MEIKQISQTGNVFIPKTFRDELGLGPQSSVIMEMVGDKIIIEPMAKTNMSKVVKELQEEMKRKKIKFTEEEMIKDDLYN
jgi:AbrB family looped-hinge helix DNA binding protein